MVPVPEALSSDFSVIAFYGIDHSPSRAEWFFDRSVKWIESLGFCPDKLGVSGLEATEKISSFSRTSKKLERVGFQNVTGYEVYATTPESKVWWSDCFLSADYEGKKAGTHVFVTARTSIASLDDPAMAQLVLDIVLLLKPAYGIGFVRPKKYGPGMYVIGILKGPPGHVSVGKEYEEDIRICRWGDTGMANEVYRCGLVRDVYPQNYLTEVHLKKLVGDISLEQWIQRDSGRGTLTRLSDKMVLWRVDDQHLPIVKSDLRRTDIVFDWTRHTKL